MSIGKSEHAWLTEQLEECKRERDEARRQHEEAFTAGIERVRERDEARAECAELKRLGRSGHTIRLERLLKELADVAREAEAMCRGRGDLTGMSETAANLRAVLAKVGGGHE